MLFKISNQTDRHEHCQVNNRSELNKLYFNEPKNCTKQMHNPKPNDLT